MAGYDASTGKPIHGDARIAQSIRRCVMTDGTLVLRRHLSCILPRLIGTPLHPIGLAARCAAIASSVATGEQRCEVRAVRPIDGTADGETKIEIAAISRETGKPIDLSELVG